MFLQHFIKSSWLDKLMTLVFNSHLADMYFYCGTVIFLILNKMFISVGTYYLLTVC